MHAVYSGGPAGAGWTQQPTIPGHVMATAIAPLIALSAAAAPVAAVSAPPWMAPLKKALQHGGTQRQKRSRSEAKRKHVQIATVDPTSGRPSVRTVVSRGFLPAALRRRKLGCVSQQGGELLPNLHHG